MRAPTMYTVAAKKALPWESNEIHAFAWMKSPAAMKSAFRQMKSTAFAVGESPRPYGVVGSYAHCVP